MACVSLNWVHTTGGNIWSKRWKFISSWNKGKEFKTRLPSSMKLGCFEIPFIQILISLWKEEAGWNAYCICKRRDGDWEGGQTCSPQPGPCMSASPQGEGNQGQRPASYSILVIGREEGPRPAIHKTTELPEHSQAGKGWQKQTVGRSSRPAWKERWRACHMGRYTWIMIMQVNIHGQLHTVAPHEYFKGFTHLTHTATQSGRFYHYFHLKLKNLRV